MINLQTEEVEMSYDKWFDEFKPMLNRLALLKNENYLPEDCAPHGGTMYETFGEEVQHVCDFANNGGIDRVWTLFDDGSISNGYHLINRMGYFITEKAVEDNVFIHVKSDWEDDDEGSDIQ